MIIIIMLLAFVLGFAGVFLTAMCAWQWFGNFWRQDVKTLLWIILYILFFMANIALVKFSPAFLAGITIDWRHYLASILIFLMGTAIAAHKAFKL